MAGPAVAGGFDLSFLKAVLPGIADSRVYNRANPDACDLRRRAPRTLPYQTLGMQCVRGRLPRRAREHGRGVEAGSEAVPSRRQRATIGSFTVRHAERAPVKRSVIGIDHIGMNGDREAARLNPDKIEIE